MKNFILFFGLYVLFFSLSLSAQNVGINTTGSSPNSSAMLDVDATDKGILIPRVALTAINVASPVTSPATGLLVYNTAMAGVIPNNVAPGFYYWNGTQWVQVITSTNASQDWTINGNTGTNAVNNFIGTTDATDFVTRTNNTEKMRVTNAGNVGIGTNPNAAALLDLTSTNKGLLPPRISLTDTKTWTPLVGSQIAGMMVYNTNNTITANAGYPISNNQGLGMYYWDGTGWVTQTPKPEVMVLMFNSINNSTNSGMFTTLTFSSVPVNTIAGATVNAATGAISLPPGTYRINGSAGLTLTGAPSTSQQQILEFISPNGEVFASHTGPVNSVNNQIWASGTGILVTTNPTTTVTFRIWSVIIVGNSWSFAAISPASVGAIERIH